MDSPISDPVVPYVGDTQGRFTPGKIIRIQGVVPSAAYRFDINLQCGPQTAPRDNIALHISVRILDGFIALNSLQRGIWGEEIRNTNLPIKRAERFEIVLMCNFYDYRVAINGRQYEFPQRIPFDHISHLTIDGDVSIIQISYESATLPGGPPAKDASRAPLLENTQDDFELIDSVDTRAPSASGVHPPLAAQATAPPPPSYEAAISAGPPYPTTSTGGMPQPGFIIPESNNVPSTSITPVNERVSGTTHIPPPPPGAPRPLNSNENYYGKRTPNSGSKDSVRCFKICMIIIFTVIGLVIVIVTKAKSSSSRGSSSSS